MPKIAFPYHPKACNTRKTFIVGLDGSELSLRATMVAGQLMDPLHDDIIICTLGRSEKERSTLDGVKSKAEDLARKSGANPLRIRSEFVLIPQEFAYSQALCYLANHEANGSAILVVGAAGKGDEDRSGRKPEGQPPMGKLAQFCLQRCKVPVVLVKSGGKRIELLLESARIKREGRDGQAGLHVMVCVEPSTVATMAFDLAIDQFVRSSDRLCLFHVATDAAVAARQRALAMATCDKLSSTRAVASANYLEVHKTHSIREHIEDFIYAHQVRHGPPPPSIRPRPRRPRPASAAADAPQHGAALSQPPPPAFRLRHLRRPTCAPAERPTLALLTPHPVGCCLRSTWWCLAPSSSRTRPRATSSAASPAPSHNRRRRTAASSRTTRRREREHASPAAPAPSGRGVAPRRLPLFRWSLHAAAAHLGVPKEPAGQSLLGRAQRSSLGSRILP